MKAVAQAEPGALVCVLQVLEAQNVTPYRLSVQRARVRGRSTSVLEIEIELAAADIATDAFRGIVATIDKLPMILSTVAPD